MTHTFLIGPHTVDYQQVKAFKYIISVGSSTDYLYVTEEEDGSVSTLEDKTKAFINPNKVILKSPITAIITEDDLSSVENVGNKVGITRQVFILPNNRLTIHNIDFVKKDNLKIATTEDSSVNKLSIIRF